MTGAGVLIYRRTCRGAANALPAEAPRHSYHPPVKTFQGRGVSQDHEAGVPGAVNGRPLIDRCRISKLRDGSMPRIAPTSVVAGEHWLALRRYLGVPMAWAAPRAFLRRQASPSPTQAPSMWQMRVTAKSVMACRLISKSPAPMARQSSLTGLWILTQSR